jgi:hypothetical protein
MSNKKEVYRSLQLLMQLQKLSARNRQDGYALLVTSVMSIVMFSMLSMYLFSSRLHKSTANAIVDAGSTFYASETALNKRANQIRQKFNAYTEPDGEALFDTDVATRMRNCIDPAAAAALKGTGDYQCTTETVYSKEAVLSTKSTNGGNISNEVKNVNYTSYTFVKPTQRPGGAPAELKVMDSGDYRGLRALDYRYRVYSTAVKQSTSSIPNNISAQSMLQMEFINRLIPVFQFAAFYENDLEFFPSGDMTVNGPIHTNKSLYMAPGKILVLNGIATYVNNAYRSLPFRATHSTDATNGERIFFNGGGPYTNNFATCYSIVKNCISSAGANSSSFSSPLAITATDITNSNEKLKKQSKLTLPSTGFLSDSGTYYNNADLRVKFNPSRTGSKFNITSINRSGATPVENIFTDDMIKSLQKPVMLRVTTDTNRSFSEITRLCPRFNSAFTLPIAGEPGSVGQAIPTTTLSSLSVTDQEKVVRSLQNAIVKTPHDDTSDTGSTSSVSYDKMDKVPTSTSTLRNNFRAEMLSAGLTAAVADNVLTKKLIEVASLSTSASSTGCFLPPPMQVLENQYDEKEARSGMFILQSNIKSLTVWNRDGYYLNGSAIQSANNKLFLRKAQKAFPTTLTNTKAITSGLQNAKCDYECLGLGSDDTSHDGLVWHYSMIDRLTPYNYVSNTDLDNLTATPPVFATRSNTKGLSKYGFAFSGATRLPGALTLASDQAIYLQGDYNNPSSTIGDLDTILDESQFPTTAIPTPQLFSIEKKPASALADSMTILSNSCYDYDTAKINCLYNWSTMPVASHTVIRAAILSGTESSIVNSSNAMIERGAGLNNHFRLLEDWGGGSSTVLKYRGSLVSQGIQREFNGQYRLGGTYYQIPSRDFGFENDFNRADGLPPLTPTVSYLQQQVFKRDYDSNSR